MGEVSFADAAALSEPANVWAAQTVWMRRIAATVTTELVERWSDPGRLTNLAVTPSATT